MYNLESLWLNEDGKCRLNAFHVKCSRHICRIAPSYFPRVPNTEIYKLTNQTFVSIVLKRQQIKLYCSIVALPENDVVRKLTCEPNPAYPRVWDGARKCARPKQQWASGVYRMAIAMGSFLY